MTYIKLEDVQKIYREIPYKSDEILDFMDDIYSIPSISFEEMIKEMIEERYKINEKQKTHYELQFEVSILNEILARLPK